MAAHAPPESPKSFFASLFDFSFQSFVTPRILKLLYVLALIGIGIYGLLALTWIIAGFNDPFVPAGLSVIALLLLPVGLLFAIIYARVLLEFIAVVFQIGDSAKTLASGQVAPRQHPEAGAPTGDDLPPGPPSAPPEA